MCSKHTAPVKGHSRGGVPLCVCGWARLCHGVGGSGSRVREGLAAVTECELRGRDVGTPGAGSVRADAAGMTCKNAGQAVDQGAGKLEKVR